MAGELVEGFAAKAQGDGRGKFHVAQGLVDAANVLDFHVGQLGEGLAKERVAEITFGIVGRIFDLAPGFDVAYKAGVGLEFSFIFHKFIHHEVTDDTEVFGLFQLDFGLIGLILLTSMG